MRFKVLASLVLLLVLAVSGFGVFGFKAFRHKDQVVPVVFGMNPAYPGPNTRTQLTVQLSTPATTDTLVSIGCTDPNAWIDLPSGVWVPAGQTSYTFYATTSPVYSNWVVVAATVNGGTALAVSYN